MNDDSLFNCPCCGFPTLSQPNAYDICIVCWWEDDGQEDKTADEVWGGPNGKYSLRSGRKNFLSHGHMYDKGFGIAAVENPTPARKRLVEYVSMIIHETAQLDIERLNRLIQEERRAK
jgi:Cysteine-rich CPCC